MTIEQIYNTLNSVTGQMVGFTAISVTDISTFYSLGNAVLASNTDTDNFLNVLVDRIGKTVLRTLDLNLDFPGLLRNEYEFGAVLQKIDIQPFAAFEATWANVGQPGFTPDPFAVNKPSVSQSLFKDSAAWSIEVSIPDTLFKTAFTSPQAMDNFISGIFDMMEKSMTMQINYVTRSAVNGMMAEKMDLSSNSVIDLLTEYNSGHTPTITAAEALESADFLRWATRFINNYITYLSQPSYLFNEGTKIRATQRDNMHIVFNQSFTSAFDVYLQSDVWHNELTSLPYYNTIPWWQGSGNTAPSDADCMSIKVQTKNGDTVEADYVLGFLADREAIGVGLYDQYSAADRNNKERYTSYTRGCQIQNYVDLSENIVVFTLGAPTITPVGP